MVFGVQWLKSLGPIIWDFNTLIMKFTVANKCQTLFGSAARQVQVATKKQNARWGNSASSTCTLLMTSINKPVNKECFKN